MATEQIIPGSTSIISTENPEWGKFGVREDKGGWYVIQGRRGQRTVSKGEVVRFWKVA